MMPLPCRHPWKPASFHRVPTALRRHVLDLSKMDIRNSLPPFESITRTPGVSTSYDITIPLGDEDETLHFSARKLTCPRPSDDLAEVRVVCDAQCRRV